MASISPSSYPSSLQMAYVSPFPTSQRWYYTMRVQISGHSSVQLSSTFGSRKARKPINILRFKKIEQGQLLYPKMCPLMFPMIFPYMVGHKPLPKEKEKLWVMFLSFLRLASTKFLSIGISQMLFDWHLPSALRLAWTKHLSIGRLTKPFDWNFN